VVARGDRRDLAPHRAGATSGPLLSSGDRDARDRPLRVRHGAVQS